MKILVLCTKCPYPPNDGGTLAMYNMIRGFHKAGHSVTVLTMNTPKHYVTLRTLPVHIQELAEFHAVDVDTRVKLADAFANLMFSDSSYHVERFTSNRFEIELERLLKKGEYDIVQLETLFMTPYIPTIKKLAKTALIALRAHNIEHEIWYRRASIEKNPFKKYYFFETAQRIKYYEKQIIAQGAFDVLVPITSRDGGSFKKMDLKKPSFFSTVGIDMENLDTSEVKEDYPSICYIGALDWGPNQEGLDWFLQKVWPRIHKAHPKVKFYIAGRRMPEKYTSIESPNIVIMGEVPNAGKFMKSKGVMVVPILSGSGMRVKIVEGMAYGKAIVATKMAAEGIGGKHGDNILLADNPQSFGDYVSVLLEKRSLYKTIGEHAREFAERRYNNDIIIDRLVSFYGKQLASKRKPKEEK